MRDKMIAGLFLLLLMTPVFAHCDTLGGPVVKAAEKALKTGNVNLVLIWVQKEDEAAIRNAFARTMAVRKVSKAVREMADMYFYETLVRIHRAGEGAPYTGIQPASSEVSPAVETVDKALAKGSIKPVLKLLNDSIQKNASESFRQLITKKKYDEKDVAAGREYVKAYVTFTHYIEKIYDDTIKPSGEHEAESAGEHTE